MKDILVVDDNEALCRLTCDILALEGYRAVPAFDAAQALEFLEREGFDVIVTDFRMRGMNGLELARAIHEVNPALPVIMVTAYGPIEDEHLTFCLAKDEMFPALIEILRRHAVEEPAIPG